MEDAVDPGTTQQFIGVHLISRALNALLKVHTKLLNHPNTEQAKSLLVNTHQQWGKTLSKQVNVITINVYCKPNTNA